MNRQGLLKAAFITLCMPLSADASAQMSEGSAGSMVFLQESGSEVHRAVFAHYLAVIPNEEQPSLNVDCAISVSNVCAAPPPVLPFMGGSNAAPERGRVSLFLYKLDGTLITYTTGPGSPGDGLDSEGLLAPGSTWTVRLAEVISSALTIPEAEVNFRGYGWVLSSFDCLAGTYSNTVFGLGFTQSYEMMPGMGQGGWFGGIPVSP